MNTFLIIIYIILVLIILLLLYYLHFKNIYNDFIIKINEAENRIDNNLKEKYSLLNKNITISKDIIQIDEKIVNDIQKLRAKKLNNFEYDEALTNLNRDFITIYENNKELKDNDKIIKNIKEIKDIDEELVTLRNYYNQKTSDYNKMTTKFPTNIISKIKKYKSKQIYEID